MSERRSLAVRARNVRTLDPRQPEVDCLLIRDGRVAAAGSEGDIRSLAGGAEWLDLGSAVVVPGLTDSHIHLLEWALGAERPDLTAVTSVAGVIDRVAEVAASAPTTAWLELSGWDAGLRDRASLERLDAAAAGRAVSLVAHDLHSVWLSSEAMGRLGIDEKTPDPPGGALERDAEGRPTGVLLERAMDLWYEGRPRPVDADRKAALTRGQRRLHERGITGVHSVEAPDAFRILQQVESAGELRLRVLHHLPQRFLDPLIECGWTSGFGGEWLRLGGIKYFTDGALGSGTAWMLEPYEGSENRGVRRLDPEELFRDVARAARAGLAATIHAIGDAAVRMTLDALEAAGPAGPRLPHRIEHLQCLHPDDLARVGRLGLVASMQPSHLLTDIALAEARWGPERSRRTMALNSLRRAGAVLAFGSDAPVERPDPREGFYAARARQTREGYPDGGWYPEERLPGLAVLEAYTLGAAYAAGDAHRRGRLAPGFDADWVAFDRDPVTEEAHSLLDLRVEATMVAGELVYRA